MTEDPATQAYDLGYFDHMLSERDHRLIGRRPLRSSRFMIRWHHIMNIIGRAEYQRHLKDDQEN